jgi:hypothetical protein
LDGAASVLVGIAANQSIRTGQLVHIDDLFPLSSLLTHKRLASDGVR